jgi:formate hydrogenlyase transcriptional activator
MTRIQKQEAGSSTRYWPAEDGPAVCKSDAGERVRIVKGHRRDTADPYGDSPQEIVGRSAALRAVLREVAIVAPTSATVLIHGETGTGKELIAHSIHDRSPRRLRPFVKINCAAIPAGLLESELFGHERGAFTGAIARKIGRLELADEGTLFLDEIGDLPLELQPKLLRVLQEHQFERLGGTQTRRISLRIVAATCRDLTQMVEEREFRSDLYYRLNVFPLRLPPLRERSEDVPPLVQHCVAKYAQQMNKQIDTIPARSMELLRAYHWPGNVRELQNLIERAVILSRGKILHPPLNGTEQSSRSRADSEADTSRTATLRDCEREHILKVLNETRWLVGGRNGAAELLGLKRTTLIAKMEKLGLSRKPKLHAEHSNQSPG